MAAHAYLSRAYWSEGISLALVQRAIEHSLCIALRCAEGEGLEVQVGFARMVTDRATYAYLCDVYVLEAHRRQGLADWMMQTLLRHPDLQGLRRLQLVTRDMQSLYARHGFQPLGHPERGMEIARPGLYLRDGAKSPP
ncbi:GNAT family N-acetyltransferase [Mitsuaria sp. WAJ17]|nr:GNAT family N-acetyltransferase [Mitsuaria sp. WAJ17]